MPCRRQNWMSFPIPLAKFPRVVKHNGKLLLQKSENKNNNFLWMCATRDFNDKTNSNEYNTVWNSPQFSK